MYPTLEKKLNDEIKLAHHLADVGGKTAFSFFRSSLDIEAKGDESPVTIADRTEIGRAHV